LALASVLAATAACGCRERGLFRDATASSGVDFRWRSDIVEAKLVATMGGGAALGDFNNDGHLDLFLPNSVRRARAASNDANCGRLYRGAVQRLPGPDVDRAYRVSRRDGLGEGSAA
jgi:hypothetical protein